VLPVAGVVAGTAAGVPAAPSLPPAELVVLDGGGTESVDAGGAPVIVVVAAAAVVATAAVVVAATVVVVVAAAEVFAAEADVSASGVAVGSDPLPVGAANGMSRVSPEARLSAIRPAPCS
jgi:hypothetical protein